MAGILVLSPGVWLMATAFLWDRGSAGGSGAAWNEFIAGAAIAALAGSRVLASARTGDLGVAAVPLGLWLIAAPFMLDLTSATAGSAATWNSLLVGALVAVLVTSPLPAPSAVSGR
ncbi:SPW repeat domain-containing protein [Actinoplanes philippinensis]|uniref:SPW repeat domain-containing protein n=1 Tax=Actinoplanes philippinensis TaxID=35752 RepID=UPI0033CA3589